MKKKPKKETAEFKKAMNAIVSTVGLSGNGSTTVVSEARIVRALEAQGICLGDARSMIAHAENREILKSEMVYRLDSAGAERFRAVQDQSLPIKMAAEEHIVSSLRSLVETIISRVCSGMSEGDRFFHAKDNTWWEWKNGRLFQSTPPKPDTFCSQRCREVGHKKATKGKKKR